MKTGVFLSKFCESKYVKILGAKYYQLYFISMNDLNTYTHWIGKFFMKFVSVSN